MGTELALTKDWYTQVEQQAAQDFVALPTEFQVRGYSYDKIAKSYLTFFNGDNKRSNKLKLAKKFGKFLRLINRNRAKNELGEDFYMCFAHYMDNFEDLVSKNDLVHLEALDLIADGLDKTRFVEDILNVEELRRRVNALKVVEEKADIIEAEWIDVSGDYRRLNAGRTTDERAAHE